MSKLSRGLGQLALVLAVCLTMTCLLAPELLAGPLSRLLGGGRSGGGCSTCSSGQCSTGACATGCENGQCSPVSSVRAVFLPIDSGRPTERRITGESLDLNPRTVVVPIPRVQQQAATRTEEQFVSVAAERSVQRRVAASREGGALSHFRILQRLRHRH